MRRIVSSEVIKGWTKVCSAVILIQLAIIDTLACILFSFLFKLSSNIKVFWLKSASILLVGNPDIRGLISINLELN